MTISGGLPSSPARRPNAPSLFQRGLITAEPVAISDELLAAYGQSREGCGPITHEWKLTRAGQALARAANS